MQTKTWKIKSMITIAIGVLMLLGYMLIASEHLSNINKAATAMFVGVVGWILFMLTGTEYISTVHAEEWTEFLDGREPEWQDIHTFIAQNVFLKHAMYICNLVMYMLATIAIVDVLNSNECFGFLKNTIKNRNSRVVLWLAVAFTFFISTNLDNLTTTVLMLLIMKKIVANDKQRIYIGAAILVAANCGGCCTVIGDTASLMVWYKDAVTPANFSGALIIPALLATSVTTYLIQRKLPHTLDLVRSTVIFRGEDSILPTWQRITLLTIGLGGLWFVPTFYRITLLPPFLGSLCVLCLLWVLNEVFNRKRIRTEQPSILKGSDHRLLYESIQAIMFVIGMCLAVGVAYECGAMAWLRNFIETICPNIYIIGTLTGFISAALDNVALVLTGINMYDVVPDAAVTSDYLSFFAQNGPYWHILVFCSAVGGCLLPIGNTAGYAFLKMEDEASGTWYLKHIAGKVLCGWAVGLTCYFIIDYFIR